MNPIVDSYTKNADALRRIRGARAKGHLTRDRKRAGDRKLIEGLLPDETPAGVLFDASTKARFLDTVGVEDFPTLAIEAAIAEYSWASKGRTDWNSLVDKFHLIPSLPYTDLVVTDDSYLHRLLPVAQKTSFVRARLMRFSAFCKDYAL